MRETQQQLEMAEELMQQLRSKATELLLREEWSESIQVYSQFINLCQHHINDYETTPDNLPKLHKSLCLALSNRAEARSRLRDYAQALKDCDEALKIESTHFKTLICKGKILLNLNRYSMALTCFRTAQLDPQANGSSVGLNGYLQKCKKLELMSKTGAFDMSEWVINGFRAKPPEPAEYIGGAVEMRKSGIRGRGLFATKNMEAGSLVLINKAVATERGILPGQDLDENAQLVMWKTFTEKVMDSVAKCSRTCGLISTLSSGEDEDGLEVPEINLFKPDSEHLIGYSNEKKLDASRVLSILDVNSIVEDSISSKVLGKNSDYYGVGLWVLASFINHSCIPNARRLHVGDYVIVHASRDVKAGEELTFAYFDVLNPLEKRNEMSKTWGFRCNCRRCKFEAELCSRQEGIGEIEMGFERGMDSGAAVYRLEEGMRKWKVKEKEKGYLRASFWAAYGSEKLMRSWGRRIPMMESVVDSIVEAVGSDERVLKMVVEKIKKGNGGSSVVEIERALKLGRGVYGKVMKKQAMKSLLGLGILEPSY
ncbi:methyltransferase FGSG_00040 [Rosa rugosa]|uniref:methyltransferase FGSG_00040 n=1 Tax=Rosa rugosa TaxID=74645 RepID=UPI002B41167A|nr:methyltransferase FGSG_00040 [Rosa rugosa]